jgi:hypothetical protein
MKLGSSIQMYWVRWIVYEEHLVMIHGDFKYESILKIKKILDIL